MNKYTPTLVWLLLCLIFVFIKSGCTPPVTPPIPIEIITPEQPITYNIMEGNGVAHRYEEDIFSLNLPLENPKLTQFCLLHTEWESLTVVINADKWQYTVIRLTP